MTTRRSRATAAAPPTKHQSAVMIWLAVFPTLTVLNLVLGDWIQPLSPVVRTFVLVTIAVPIVSYGLMPRLQQARARLLHRTRPGTIMTAQAQPEGITP